MFSDLGLIIRWWAGISAIGLIFLPLTRKIFRDFFDQGYLFAKVLGLGASAYAVWLLASLKILPFYSETIWLVAVAGIAFNFWLVKFSGKFRPERGRLKIWLLEEGLFLAGLITWAWVRGFQPDIQGLEKFMDFGFVNTILRSKYFPPTDMWFAGKLINYYYFGHYLTAFLTKLTQIDSAITYNLMIATLFSFTLSLTFSFTANLINRLAPAAKKTLLVGGLAAAILASLGANLHPAYYNFKMKILKKPYCDGSLSYWYPNATRYIGYCPDVDDKTIHEFPSYSFIVSDLHGHVSDIPFVLLFLALSLSLFSYLKKNKQRIFSFEFLVLSLPMSLTLAIMYMTNQWDFPIYLTIFGLLVTAVYYRQLKLTIKNFLRVLTIVGITVLPAAAMILPFQVNFDPIAKGIALVHARSLPYQLFVLWGVPWFFGLVFLIFLWRRQSSFIKESDRFVLVILLAATGLVFIPEFIYLKDIYISSYHRANTMFKLTYQSFILFSIAIGYILSRVPLRLKKDRAAGLRLIFSLLIVALVIYPRYSIPGYYGRLNPQNYKNIYGLGFLERLYPDDYRAILWLNQKVKDQPVIVEAAGDSYTDYSRISMATGLPTIQGWLVHEWLWRGSFDEPGKRATEVQTIYESSNAGETKTVLDKYQVKYIIVGEMERKKYPNLNEAKIKKMGKKVFESGQTAVYELF